MKLKRGLTLIALVVLAQTACSPTAAVGTTAPATEAAAQPTLATAQATLPPAPSGSDGRLDIVACEIVTPQQVAELAGGTIFRELEQEPSPACIYEVAAGPDGYAQFIVSIQPPDIAEASIAMMPEELGQPVVGMGDAAYLEHDQGADTYHLLVLVRDRFGLNVSGESEDWTLALGQLFLSRLLGP